MPAVPKVTVLILVYNTEQYLKECIDSVLAQTFTDFECLLVDDCSTDNGVAVIQSYQDPRIRLVRNEQNLGLARNSNKGFELARGEYIVFADSDDINVPTRLEKLVAFMDANPEIGFCGSWIQEIDSEGRVLPGRLLKYPTDPDDIKERLFRECALWNPSLIHRRSVIQEHHLYRDEDFVVGDDFELFVRASAVTKLANIPEVLYLYRRHEKQISTLRAFEAWRNSNIVRLSMIMQEIKMYHREVNWKPTPVRESNSVTFFTDLLQVDQILAQLSKQAAPADKNRYVRLTDHLQQVWLSSLFYIPRYTLSIFRLTQKSHFYHTLPFVPRMKILGKSLLGLDKNMVRRLRSLLTGRKVEVWQ